jgi:hypothetical protein
MSGGLLRVFDVRDPAGIAERARFTVPRGGQELVVSGTLALVASPSVIGVLHQFIGSVQVLDVSEPISPTLLSTIGGRGGDVQVAGDTAYIVGAGLSIVDIRDPRHPVVLASIDDNSISDFAKLRVAGGVAYVSAGGELRLYDVRDSRQPRLISKVPVPETVDTSPFVVADGLLYLPSDAGVTIFDVRDPTSPTLLGQVGVPGGASDIALAGELVYATSGKAGFHALRVNPRAFSRVLLPLASDGIVIPQMGHR